MENILIVVSHPDDWSNGMGGTVLKLSAKYKINVICTTKGEYGIHGVSPKETAQIREQEERNACTKVAANITFLGLIDSKVFPDKNSCFKVLDIMKELNPVAIFTSWPMDFHSDHIATSCMTRKAFDYWGNPDPEFYFLAHGLTQTSQFIPDIYVDISDVFEEKLKLVKCHKSQNKDDFLVKNVTDRGIYYAAMGNPHKMKYAEGFKTLTPCVNKKSWLSEFLYQQ
jgi:LmbE family N-acetylglucosaminyl deacetylase